ncbi:Myelin-oligodendrocyte glycoprotein [Nibea albiflora]|uniref:Myelin-oligodendrocyte glycoprotein n=1 Tax=Nibea albiflora TaxID=240163 RepID=A0ACB7EWA5_NIBAL|nr:Myelin-oligodendrocyte glycoprotein [Nibea albiflora]
MWMENVAVLFASTGESEASKPVEVTFGGDAILLCSLTRSYDMQSLRVEWTRDGKDVHLYRRGSDDLTHQDKSFEGRTSLFHEEMSSRNISLKLSGVTAGDSGNYTCRVYANNIHDHFKECSIALNVTGVIVAVAVIMVAMVSGVGLFLLVKNRSRRGRQQNTEERVNLNNMRNDDNAER